MRYYEVRTLNERQLDELRMAPSNLKQFANSQAAQGIRAGFEAELIFLGQASEDDEQEMEPNYDMDRRPEDIDDIMTFFTSGEHSSFSSNPTSPSYQRHLQELVESWDNWVFQDMDEDWSDEREDAIRQWVIEHEDVIDSSPDDDDWDEKLEERVEQAIQDQDYAYDSAYEDWQSNEYETPDHSDWLEYMGWRSMSDIASEFGWDWPYYEYNDSSNVGGGYDVDSAKALAYSLGQELGVSTKVSSGYHKATRNDTDWIFEPDGSLDPDDAEDMPVEIITPPMPLNDTLRFLDEFFEWAKNNGAYANKSCGFHMSVSLPNQTSENIIRGDMPEKKIDFVKLALFLGDKYVLEQFDRLVVLHGTNFAESVLEKLEFEVTRGRKINSDQELSGRARDAMAELKSGLMARASKALNSGTGYGKYFSINPKEGYIEFRSAGNQDYFADVPRLKNMLTRYAYAMSVAGDPEAAKAEYAKKLYKLLGNIKTRQVTDLKGGRRRTEAQQGINTDAMMLFSRYVAGEMTKPELSTWIKKAQLKRKQATNPTGEKTQWRVLHPNGMSSITVMAHSADEAIMIAKREYTDTYNPSSSYTAISDPDTTQSPHTPAANSPGGDPDGNFVIRQRYRSENGLPEYQGSGPVLYRFRATGPRDAIDQSRAWVASQGGRREEYWLSNVDNVPPEILNARPTNLPSQTDAENRLGLGDQTADANYEIIDNRNQTSVFKFIANTSADASTRYNQWLEIAGLPTGTHDYGVRRLGPRTSSMATQHITNRLHDVVTEPQNFPAARSAGNEFSGEWRVVDGLNREVHRFGGIGNSQSDANRVAREWAQRTGFDGNLEVYPVMR